MHLPTGVLLSVELNYIDPGEVEFLVVESKNVISGKETRRKEEGRV